MAWTAAIGAGMSAMLTRRVRLLSDTAHWQRHTAAIQLRQLRRLLETAASTRFGVAHGFSRLTRTGDADLVRAYRAQVPVGDYEAFRAHIGRMRDDGESDVLWPGLVRHFAQTSGTTAGDKHIPVTREMLRSNRRAALDIFANARRFGQSLPDLLTGKVLFLGGSTDLSANRHGIRTGDLSGLVAPLIRWPISSIYLPGKRIALMSDWPAKIEAMARACVDADVRMISGMPSWMLVLFERVMRLARERGRRADALRDVWPNLRLIVHGGVKYTPFEPRIRAAWSGLAVASAADTMPRRLEIYPASEGFIAMQDRAGDPAMRLLADLGNFYEFIPLERIGEAHPPAFTAERVEKGQRYVVCMSTCAGLWRYIIGDVVEFDSVPAAAATAAGPGEAAQAGHTGDGPCRLRIVGRHRHFINAFGENLIVEHIENAVAAAAAATGLLVGEFTAGPIYPDPPARRAGLELAVELAAGSAPPGTLGRFADAFDAALKEQNVDYTTKRTASLGMAAPTITVLAPGAIHRWMLARGKLGGQHKCPRCANHREVLDGVLGVARA